MFIYYRMLSFCSLIFHMHQISCHPRSSSSSTNQSFVPVTMQSFTSTPALRRCKSQWVSPLLCTSLLLRSLLLSRTSETSVKNLNNSQPQALICLVDKKTGEKSKTRPRFVKQDQVCIARLRAAGVICLETFKDFPQMGRFTLRDEGVHVISLSCLSMNVSGQCLVHCGLIHVMLWVKTTNWPFSLCMHLQERLSP